MKTFFKKLFTSNSTMNWATVLTSVFAFINATSNIQNSLFCFLADYMLIIALLILLRSFMNHEKNVMKGLIGSLLMWVVLIELENLVTAFNAPEAYTSLGTIGYCYLVVCVLIVALCAFVFLNHFMINSDHHSNPAKILMNQYSIFILAVLLILEMIFTFCIGNTDSLHVLITVSAYVRDIVLLATVVCIESQLDAYRIRREANGWVDPEKAD